MNNGKSPGTDGLTVEFYKFFWPEVGLLVLSSLSFGLDRGLLSVKQRRGIIFLIPKKDRNRMDIGNWRPITLLKFDLKIVTKAKANKLVPCLHGITGKEQTGFLKGRFIGENIRLIDNIIDYCRHSLSLGLLLQFVFEKAFDKVRWGAILESLKTFGFWDPFIDMIGSLFNGIESTIMNSGFTSTYFSPANGIRQGCSVSPYLFLLVVEIPAHKIRLSSKIQGIKVGSGNLKLAMYADDLTCFAENKEAAEKCKRSLDEFAVWSGLRINWSKSEAMYQGGEPPPHPDPNWIKIVSRARILGVILRSHNTVHTRYYDNFKPILDKMQAIFRQWKNRNLSLKGKIVVFNSLVVSLLSYMTSVIYNPPRVIKEVKAMVRAYVWSGKRPKIAYDTLIQKIELGGLRLADLETRVKASYVQWVGWHPLLGAWVQIL